MPVDEIAKAAGNGAARNPTSAGSLRAIIEFGAGRTSPPRHDGPSASAGRSGVDPLAELARLIDQDETFGAIVRNRGSEQRGGLSVGREDLPASRAGNPFEHDGDRGGGCPLVPSHLCDGPTSEPRPHESRQHDGSDYANGLPNERRVLKVFAAVIGLGLLAGCAGAMAYWAWSDGRVRSDEARVIATSIGPDKAVPSPQGEDNGARLHAQERSVARTGSEEKQADAKLEGATHAPPLGVVYGAAPTQVAALAPGAAPPESPAVPAQIQPPEVKEPAAGDTAPGATEPPAQGPRYIVQLSSQRSEAAAQATSRLLQTKYPDVFGVHQPSIRRSDFGDRGVYYRVQIGPFSISEAKELCGNLKKSGADCVVQKN
jgi:SPOR domain